jgi:hypothetical protein
MRWREQKDGEVDERVRVGGEYERRKELEGEEGCV